MLGSTCCFSKSWITDKFPAKIYMTETENCEHWWCAEDISMWLKTLKSMEDGLQLKEMVCTNMASSSSVYSDCNRWKSWHGFVLKGPAIPDSNHLKIHFYHSTSSIYWTWLQAYTYGLEQVVEVDIISSMSEQSLLFWWRDTVTCIIYLIKDLKV